MSNSNEEVSPPSMVAGGFMQQQSAPDAPRSAPLPGQVAQQLQSQNGGMGGTDMGLLRMLMQPAPTIPMSAGQVYAGAAYGGVHPGQANPIVQGNADVNTQARQQQADQQRQAELVQKYQDRQREQADKRNELAINASKELMDSPSLEVRERGAKDYARLRGIPVTSQTIQDMVTKRLSKDERLELYGMLSAGRSDAYVLDYFRSKGLTQQDLQGYKQDLTRPDVRKALDIKSPEELADDAVKRTKARNDAWFSGPGRVFKGNEALMGESFQVAQDRYGKDYTDLSPQEQSESRRIAQERMTKRSHDEDAYQSMLKIRERQATEGGKPIGRTGKIWVDDAGRPLPPGITESQAEARGGRVLSPKDETDLRAGRSSLTMLQNVMGTARELDGHHLFQEHGGIVGAYEQVVIGGTKLFGDPKGDKALLQRWTANKSELIALLRSLGDKGVRAIAAFNDALSIMEAGGSYKAAEEYFRQVDQAIREAAPINAPRGYDDIKVFPTPTPPASQGPAIPAGRIPGAPAAPPQASPLNPAPRYPSDWVR